MRLLAFSGIILPLTVGAVASAFGSDASFLPVVIWLAGLLGIGQLGLSAWALTSKWDDALGYSQESMTDNSRIADEFRKLAQDVPPDFKIRHAIIEAEARSRNTSDQRQGITDEEKRIGMRAALRQFERSRAGCNTVPKSMKATSCGVCGNFK